MAARVTPAGNQTFGGFAPSSFANGVAGGWIGYASRSTDQTGITTEVAVSSVTVPVTVNASRRIMVAAKAAYVGTNVDTVAQLTIKDGSTVLDYDRGPTAFANLSYNKSLSPVWIGTPSTGSHTYAAFASRVVGTGTVTLVADIDRLIYIAVFDLGPAT